MTSKTNPLLTTIFSHFCRTAFFTPVSWALCRLLVMPSMGVAVSPPPNTRTTSEWTKSWMARYSSCYNTKNQLTITKKKASLSLGKQIILLIWKSKLAKLMCFKRRFNKKVKARKTLWREVIFFNVSSVFRFLMMSLWRWNVEKNDLPSKWKSKCVIFKMVQRKTYTRWKASKR